MGELMKFKTVLADPPWDYKNKATRSAAAKNYPTMTDEELQALPVIELIDDNAHLYLWSPTDHIREALALMNAWDFEYKTLLPWIKFTKHGKIHFGMGNYFRSCCELLLFGVHGKMRTLTRNTRNLIRAKKPPRHSAKPPIAYIKIEANSPSPRIELFARETRPGWTSIGRDIDGKDIRDAMDILINYQSKEDLRGKILNVTQ